MKCTEAFSGTSLSLNKFSCQVGACYHFLCGVTTLKLIRIPSSFFIACRFRFLRPSCYASDIFSSRSFDFFPRYVAPTDSIWG